MTDEGKKYRGALSVQTCKISTLISLEFRILVLGKNIFRFVGC